MRIELKGLIAAVLAGLAVVGGAFGVSALVVGTQSSQGQPQTATRNTQAQPSGAAPQVADAAFVAQGHAFFTQSCASCHGTEGAGGYGPNLHNSDLGDATITTKINNGVPGRMPAFGAKYNATQVQSMVAYIRSLK